MLTHEEYELVARFLNDALDDDQAGRFRVLLQENPEARKALRDFAMVDSKLSEMAVSAPLPFDLTSRPLPSSESCLPQARLAERLTPENVAAGAKTVYTPRRFSQNFAVRAAALGLLLGAIGSSIGWAIAVPRWVGAGKLCDIFRESFETTAAPVAQHIPKTPGIWSGDYTEIVGTQDGVSPFDGQRMLSFLRADYEGKVGGEHGFTSETFYLIDLRPHKQTLKESIAKVRIRAMFNQARQEPRDRYVGSIGMAAFTDRVLKRFPKMSDAVLMNQSLVFTRNSRLLLDDMPQSWQPLVEEARMPANADYLMVRIGVAHYTTRQQQVNFEGLFADDLRVMIMKPNEPPELLSPIAKR
jgi:hypothetical protein